MRNNRLYTLLVLLLMAGRMTMQGQNVEDNFWMAINPPPTGVYSLIKGANGNIIVGLYSGVYSSSDEGVTWDFIGLDNIGVLRLYEHTDGTLLAGTNMGHPLRKREAGSTEWRNLPVPTISNGLSIGVTADNALILGTWHGIYKSRDWDATWTNVHVDSTGACAVTDLLRLDNGTMLASIVDYMHMGLGGLFQSTDNGETWENIGFVNDALFCLAQDSQGTIYLGGNGLFRSSDYGATWQMILGDCAWSIAIDNNDVIFANLFCRSRGLGVIRSADYGETWEYVISGKDSEVDRLYLADDGYLYGFGSHNTCIYRSRKSVYEEFEVEVVSCPENGGTASGSGTYRFGEYAHLIASPNENYQFVGWTNQDGETISTEDDYYHMIARGGQITANFQSLGELVVTPDTLWFENIGTSQHFTIDNQRIETVTIQNIILDPNSYLDIQSPQNFPYALPPGGSVQVTVWFQVLPAKEDYTPFNIRILTSLGERNVVAMVTNSAITDHGLTIVGMHSLTFEVPEDNPQRGMLMNQNYGTHTPITITSITEDGTDYLDIEPQHALPYDLAAAEYFWIDMTAHILSKSYATTTVTVESSAGQKQFSVAINGDLLTIAELSDVIKLYPNPTNGVVRIEGVVADEVQVYNALGQVVKTVRNSNEVSLEGLVEGVYLMRITDKEGRIFLEKVMVR